MDGELTVVRIAEKAFDNNLKKYGGNKCSWREQASFIDNFITNESN